LAAAFAAAFAAVFAAAFVAAFVAAFAACRFAGRRDAERLGADRFEPAAELPAAGIVRCLLICGGNSSSSKSSGSDSLMELRRDSLVP